MGGSMKTNDSRQISDFYESDGNDEDEFTLNELLQVIGNELIQIRFLLEEKDQWFLGVKTVIMNITLETLDDVQNVILNSVCIAESNYWIRSFSNALLMLQRELGPCIGDLLCMRS